MTDLPDLPVEECKAMERVVSHKRFASARYREVRVWLAAREYSKQREEKLRGALRRADELLMAANGALGRARAHAYDAPDRSILVSALEDTAARLAAVSDTTLTALTENGDSDE